VEKPWEIFVFFGGIFGFSKRVFNFIHKNSEYPKTKDKNKLFYFSFTTILKKKKLEY
jgi:hypothetical protein